MFHVHCTKHVWCVTLHGLLTIEDTNDLCGKVFVLVGSSKGIFAVGYEEALTDIGGILDQPPIVPHS